MNESATAPTQMSAFLEGQKFGCILADPFRDFVEGSPRCTLEDICALPVAEHMEDRAHCYLWVPNSLLPQGMKLLQSWGFKYTSNIVWQTEYTANFDAAGGTGEAFADVTQILLFGIRGKNVRTLAPARSTVNFIQPDGAGAQGEAGKPDEQYRIIERCSWGPFLELFGQAPREGWVVWPEQMR